MSHARRAPGAVLVGFVIAALAAVTVPLASASDTAMRLIDGEGVIHVTNVPADPRYRGLPGATTGTRAGWLRLSDRAPGRYDADIREMARQYGVSPALVEAVVTVESGFDPSAVSPKGAGGLMQLMPQTASSLGVLDRFDPRENIRGGVRHLRYLLDRYRGRVALALAAYNAGEGAVDAHRGVPPFPETEQYVARVLRGAGMTSQAEHRTQIMYRFVDPDTDTLTYSNIAPRPRQSSPQK